MTTKEIAFYYKSLPNGEKGRFTAHISLELGGSPHSWQQKFLKWFNEEGQVHRFGEIPSGYMPISRRPAPRDLSQSCRYPS